MSKSFNLNDVSTAATLTSMAMLNAFCPESFQDGLLQRCAALHIALRGSRAKEIDGLVVATGLGLEARKLERDFLTSVYQDVLYTLREYRRRGWTPEVRLRGRRHIEDALRRGKGAVLWAFPCTFGGLVGRKALHSEGFDVAMLSSDIHPYSGTRFGRRFLNPIRTNIEDRYIVERVSFHPGAAAIAVWRMARLLRDNKIVEIAAIGARDSRASFPFLGGTLKLEIGAPTVAGMTGAALLPYFPIPVGREKFELCIEAPLQGCSASDARDDAIHRAQQYAAIMEQYVLKVPHVWRGWFSRTSWRPQI